MPTYNLPDGQKVSGRSRVQCYFAHHDDVLTIPKNTLGRMSPERLAQLEITVTPDPPKPPPAPPTHEQMAVRVQQERKRRLELGFDYDFGMMEDGVTPDPRGIHTIGTTDADWVGWNEVINLANALIDVGDTESTIDIVTDTGPASVTAPEWQSIMLAGAADRQVIWAKSFELQNMDPIPENFEDDSFWS